MDVRIYIHTYMDVCIYVYTYGCMLLSLNKEE